MTSSRFFPTWAALLVPLLICSVHPSSAAAATTTFTREQYRDALEKCLLFFEGQRSGPLPFSTRNTWRGDSGLDDGADNGVDLVGGYYDAGDNVKFGFPMAYTATVLSWGIIKYRREMIQAGQIHYALDAVEWTMDYLLKAVAGPTQIWVQVGDGDSDHACWERPEDMDTSRKSYQVNASHPGSEPAAETAAAMAAGSIVFRTVDARYSKLLCRTAEMAFDFADTYRKSFNDSCPFYCSYSGYYVRRAKLFCTRSRTSKSMFVGNLANTTQSLGTPFLVKLQDELLWGAAWLYRATRKDKYLQYLQKNAAWSYTVSQFEWDNKMAGMQILLSKFDMDGIKGLSAYRSQADQFVCSTLPTSSQRVNKFTPGGLLYVSDSNNLHCVAASSLIIAIYADDLNNHGLTLTCGNDTFQPSDLFRFSKSQVDYMLGNNPMEMSYMAGFGSTYPQRLHHRGASIVSYKEDPTPVTCAAGYELWFSRDAPNPNVHIGAFVGGPDGNDSFTDERSDWPHLEPMTYLNAAMCPLLARIWRPVQLIEIGHGSTGGKAQTF